MSQPHERAPHILLLVVDCLRSDKVLGPRRPSGLRTIPRLVESGTSFPVFYSVASHTPICFSSILSGFYPTSHQVQSLRGSKFPARLPTLAEQLREAGYRTEAYMSGPLGPEFGLNRGFDEYVHLKKWGTLTGNFGAQLLTRLRELRTSPQPWFVVFHFWSLHKFRRYSTLFPLLMRLPPGALRAALDRVDEVGGRILQKIGTERLYDACLRDIDWYMGRMMEAIDPARTVVCLTGDHGEYLGFPDENVPPDGCPLLSKYHGYHVYDQQTRVPFVATGPGWKQGYRDDLVRSAVDITPTLLEQAGVRAQCDGVSLKAALTERPVFLEAMVSPHYDPQQLIAGVRFGKWKYACRPHREQIDAELYDLEADPFERNNVAALQPAVAAQGLELIRQHFSEDAESKPREALSAEDEEKVAERLRSLGYIE